MSCQRRRCCSSAINWTLLFYHFSVLVYLADLKPTCVHCIYLQQTADFVSPSSTHFCAHFPHLVSTKKCSLISNSRKYREHPQNFQFMYAREKSKEFRNFHHARVRWRGGNVVLRSWMNISFGKRNLGILDRRKLIILHFISLRYLFTNKPDEIQCSSTFLSLKLPTPFRMTFWSVTKLILDWRKKVKSWKEEGAYREHIKLI